MDTLAFGVPQNTSDLWKHAEQGFLRAVTLAQKDDCRRFIENLALAAFGKVAGPLSPEDADYVRKNNASLDTFLDKLGTANWIIVNTPNENRALASESTQTITFYKDFFGQRYTNDLVLNNEDNTYYSNRTVTERAQTLIHEGLHLLAPGFSDALLGELISGKAIKGSEDERRKKGSRIISDAVAAHCK